MNDTVELRKVSMIGVEDEEDLNLADLYRASWRLRFCIHYALVRLVMVNVDEVKI